MCSALCEPSDHAIKRYEHSPWNAHSSSSSEHSYSTHLRCRVLGLPSLWLVESPSRPLHHLESPVQQSPMQTLDDVLGDSGGCCTWQPSPATLWRNRLPLALNVYPAQTSQVVETVTGLLKVQQLAYIKSVTQYVEVIQIRTTL